jgi:diacylglycerol kinase
MVDEVAEHESPPGLMPVPEIDESAFDFEALPVWAARGGRQTSRDKLAAGLRGLKHAIRGDSSFFAHAYRGILIVITAALLGIDQRGWCLLILGACLVLLSELTHSAIDTLTRATGDAEAPPMKMAREIAAAGVLVAAFASGTVTVTVLLWKLGELLGWWA